MMLLKPITHVEKYLISNRKSIISPLSCNSEIRVPQLKPSARQNNNNNNRLSQTKLKTYNHSSSHNLNQVNSSQDRQL